MAAPPPPIALPPIPFEDPTLYPARRNVNVLVVDENNVLQQERAYLMQADTANPSHAYQRWPKASQPLKEGGEVVYCQVLLRNTQEQQQQVMFYKSDMTVAIKKIQRKVIDPPIQQHKNGTGPALNENPYNEVRVMQDYGNYENIMQCYEALQDQHYLYIVMLFLREGDLFSHVTPGLGGGYQPPSDVPHVFKKLVHNLQYLQQHSLVHRDLKPENCMLKSAPLWVPFIDFAMTLQAAVMEGNAQDIISQGPAGSPCYISPEVFYDGPFNYKADVWALGNVLWNLLTGLRLYHLPADESFSVMIVAHGLTNQAYCEEQLQQLMQSSSNAELLPRLQAVQVLSPVARDLLSRLLQVDPSNRPTLEEILLHPFFH